MGRSLEHPPLLSSKRTVVFDQLDIGFVEEVIQLRVMVLEPVPGRKVRKERKRKKKREREKRKRKRKRKKGIQIFFLISQLGEQKALLENDLAFLSFLNIKEMLVGKFVNNILVQKLKAALELFGVF